MSRAEARMSVDLYIGLRTARPHHEIQMQLVARRLQTVGVQRANGLRFGRAVDEIVEPVDEAANAGVAANELIRSGRGLGNRHAEMYSASVCSEPMREPD